MEYFSHVGVPKRPLHITQEGRFLVFRPGSKQQAGKECNMVAKAGSSLKLLERATSHDHYTSRVKDFRKLFPPAGNSSRGSQPSERQQTAERGLPQRGQSQRSQSQHGQSQRGQSHLGHQRGLPQLLKALPPGVRNSHTTPVQLPLIVDHSKS